jgi:hypothetical protein
VILFIRGSCTSYRIQRLGFVKALKFVAENLDVFSIDLKNFVAQFISVIFSIELPRCDIYGNNGLAGDFQIVADAAKIGRKRLHPSDIINVVEIDQRALRPDVIIAVCDIQSCNVLHKAPELFHSSEFSVAEIENGAVVRIGDFVHPARDQPLPGVAGESEFEVIGVKLGRIMDEVRMLRVENNSVSSEMMQNSSCANFRHAEPDEVFFVRDR